MLKTILILFTLFFIGCGSSSGGEHSSFNISNISPLVDVNDTYLIEENTREAFQVKATDNSNLKYYLSGKDANFLYIDTITGELFFNEPTNYEKKSIYNFLLIVEDSVRNRAIKEISIKIIKGEKVPPNTTPPTENKKRAFITLWEVTSEDRNITIPTLGDGYNYTVDWGDGSVNKHIRSDSTHTYENTGTYTISISGQFPRIYFKKRSNNTKLLSIQQWGDNEWKSMGGAFSGCKKMTLNTSDIPNLSQVTNMHSMFELCKHFNQDINSWDVSHVINMKSMFSQALLFNQSLSQWDVSHVTNMSYMFVLANKFNQPLNSWDVSSVTNMNAMFAMSHFNQPLSNWDVSGVTNMSYIFAANTSFNQNLNNWDVSSVENMKGMFAAARNYNQPMNYWDVSSVKNMENMFDSANLFNANISNWNVTSVTNMNKMFINAKTFSHQDLRTWNISSVASNAHKNFFTGAGEGNIEPLWRE